MRPERRAGTIGQAKAHGPYSVWDRKSLEGFELGVIFKITVAAMWTLGCGGLPRWEMMVARMGCSLGSWYLGMLIGSMTIRTPDRQLWGVKGDSQFLA